MKSFVLAFLLVFCGGHLFGQNVSPREIVRKSLLKATSGKKVSSFKLITTFDRPGTVALKSTQRSPMLDLIESVISAAPDSVKERMATEMKRANETFDRELLAMYEGLVEVSIVDLDLKKSVSLRIGLTGPSDTSRTVIELGDGKIAGSLFMNPVLMLQYMAVDTVELHYTGSAVMGNEQQHIVQAKIAGQWIDVMIGKESQLLSRIVVLQVDTDPLIGKGPVHYKDSYIFRNYKKMSGLLLPSGLEETSTGFGVTVRYDLAWSSINQPFPDSTFAREPTPEEKVGFRFTEIGDGLFIMELTGQHFRNERTLVRESDRVIDLFTGFIYNEVIIAKIRKALAEQFPGKRIRNIFGSEAITSISVLSGLLDAQTKLYAPKGLGIFSSENWLKQNAREDSTWRAWLSEGLLHPFQTGFEQDGCRAIILNANPNPDYDRWQVCYYLSSQKVIYVNGYLGATQPGERNTTAWAKNLCDMVDREALPVEKVICPHGITREASLEMSYEKFRRSVRGQ